jgi:hypothetical protein
MENALLQEKAVKLVPEELRNPEWCRIAKNVAIRRSENSVIYRKEIVSHAARKAFSCY